jgi:hypothetical protein
MDMGGSRPRILSREWVLIFLSKIVRLRLVTAAELDSKWKNDDDSEGDDIH